jgi:hypothetical protein
LGMTAVVCGLSLYALRDGLTQIALHSGCCDVAD